MTTQEYLVVDVILQPQDPAILILISSLVMVLFDKWFKLSNSLLS